MEEKAMENMLDAWIAWVAQQEETVLAEGQPLTEDEVEIARGVGVREPERVRVMEVERIEIPPALMTMLPGIALDQVPDSPGGMCLGHGIMLPKGFGAFRRALLAHELTHTRQMEEMGLEGFAREYFDQVTRHGFMGAPLEREPMENMVKYGRGG